MSQELKALCLAFDAAQDLPAADKADVLEGIASLSCERFPEISNTASAAATNLREAELRQLTLRELLRSIPTVEASS